MATILAELKEARDLSIDLLNWVASFDIPDMEHDYEFIALKHETEYPFAEGRIVSTKGLDIAAKNFEDHIEEEHVEYSNALHAKLKERDNYFVGPLARYNLNQQKLPPLVKQHIQAIGFPDYCKNPFQSIIVRAIEVLFAFDEAIRIIENEYPIDVPIISLTPKKASGFAATEAPRGLLYQRYDIEEDGTISLANIIPPTSQNQKTIEQDLAQFVRKNLHLDETALTHSLEQVIRNYDPCISCSTHFLKVHIDNV